MENRTRKKRSQSSSQRKERTESGKSGTGNRRPSGSTNTRTTSGTDRRSSPPAGISIHTPHSPLNIPLNPETAKQAIILSEVIGKPVSKRGKRW